MIRKINVWLGLITGALAFKNKKTPSASLANGVIVYAADFEAGKSCLHARTEDGKVIQLYPGDALTAPNAGAINSGDATTDAVITANRTRLAEIEAILVAQGLLTEA